MENSTQIKSIMTAKELLDLRITELPMLVEGLIQQTGLVGVTGSSDVGKSCFLRQLALSIAYGSPEFLGFRLNIRSGKVIYISTEDMMTDIAFLIRKQLADPQEIDDCWDNLVFITDTENLQENLEGIMNHLSPDCVIIDAFTDIHKGDNNMATNVRATLNDFKNLAQRYHSLFVILNHVGKRTENNSPSKHNSLGSQGFEAKMRMLVEFRRDKDNRDLRHLCIVKGNYIDDADKERSFVLEMDRDTLTFQNTGQRVPIESLGSQERNSMKDVWLPRCCELKSEDSNRTVDDILEIVQNEGFTGSRATVGNYLRECDTQ